MNLVKISQIDYRYVLVEEYKEFGLTENELVTLLLIDNINKEKHSLITGDMLMRKMHLSSSEIDECIISLMSKGFLSYEQEGEILITSLEKTYQKVISYITKKITEEDELRKDKKTEDAMSRVLTLLQDEMKRSLTPLELDIVSQWFKDNIDEEVIINSINEVILKTSKVSIKQVDRLIIKNLSHTDRVEEGFSTVDEKTKKDIKKAMDIASYDWVNNHD